MALQLLEECKTWATGDTISYSVVISACEKGVVSMVTDLLDLASSVGPSLWLVRLLFGVTSMLIPGRFGWKTTT